MQLTVTAAAFYGDIANLPAGKQWSRAALCVMQFVSNQETQTSAGLAARGTSGILYKSKNSSNSDQDVDRGKMP